MCPGCPGGDLWWDVYAGITFFMGGVVPSSMKEDVVQPLKTLLLDPIITYNFHSNLLSREGGGKDS